MTKYLISVPKEYQRYLILRQVWYGCLAASISALIPSTPLMLRHFPSAEGIVGYCGISFGLLLVSLAALFDLNNDWYYLIDADQVVIEGVVVPSARFCLPAPVIWKEYRLLKTEQRDWRHLRILSIYVVKEGSLSKRKSIGPKRYDIVCHSYNEATALAQFVQELQQKSSHNSYAKVTLDVTKN